MSDDQFTRLFKYVETRFGDMEKRFDQVSTQDSVDRLASSVDALIGYYKDQQDEQTARDLQWERLIEWAREVSKKTGILLKDL